MAQERPESAASGRPAAGAAPRASAERVAGGLPPANHEGAPGALSATSEEGAAPHRAPAPGALATERTDCCVVGGGPGGALLALLLARQGVRVTLLEQHHDFDRDFRGDTLHPPVLEILDQIGLAQRVLALPHAELRQARLMVDGRTAFEADFSHLPTKFPYVALVPQADFLPLLVEEARRYPGFVLRLGAAVRELIDEDGIVRGVRYETERTRHALRATLTVGADGRFSTVRRLAGIALDRFAQPIDVLWFRVPRSATAPEPGLGRVGHGHILAILPRHDAWQLGWVFPKGGYQRLRAAGLGAFKEELCALVPELREGIMAGLTDWHQVSLLSVEASRARRWYRPGLLLIGDAAHVMSPVGGVGINYAIQDAVAAANILTEPLRAGHVGTAPLVRVQLEREVPTLVIQTLQNVLQRRIVTTATRGSALLPAWLLRLPLLRELPARIIGFGLWRVRVAHPEITLSGA